MPSQATPPPFDDQSDDITLMAAIGAGNDRALALLIDRWKGPLLNFFYRSTSSREVAEDLAQVTFIRLYRAAPSYTPQAKFSTFLFHIARRLLINEFRRRQRKPAEAADPADLDAAHAAHGTGTAAALAEIEEAFQLALVDLPENQRTALLLLKQQELSYDEIARLMGASESAVKTWIFRARQALKEKLRDIL